MRNIVSFSIIFAILVSCDRPNNILLGQYQLINHSSYQIRIDFYTKESDQNTSSIILLQEAIWESEEFKLSGAGGSLEPLTDIFEGDSVVIYYDDSRINYFSYNSKPYRNIFNVDQYIKVMTDKKKTVFLFEFTDDDYNISEDIN